MDPENKQRAMSHFSRHLFSVGKLYVERKKARNDLYYFLDRMKANVIRMNIGYSHIERLRKKIDSLMILESKYARLFKTDNEDMELLQRRVKDLESDLKNEREKNTRLMMDYDDKVKDLSESLSNVKKHLRGILIDKAKRHSKLIALEKKIHRIHQKPKR